jgi:putative endonuclease
MSSPRQSQGFDAETRALAHLQAQGLTLVTRQWRCRFGEIDLIMRDGAMLVFVEVRQRKAGQFGGALQSLSASKMQRVVRACELYLAEHAYRGACRIDAVLVDAAHNVEWLKNVSG